jgi:hypothetical protein
VESLESRLLLYSAAGNAWNNPQIVTISFVPDGTNLGGVTSNLQSTFNSKPALAGRWQNIILQAAQAWAQQTNLNFVVVPDNGAAEGSGANEEGNPGFGDIRIGGYNFGSSTIARTYEPPPVNNFSIAGNMTFNTGVPFNVGSTYDLLSVAMHEFGHALGLGESTGGASGSSAVEYPTYTGVKTTLATDDIQGIQSIYSGGNPRTPDVYNTYGSDGTFATATNLNGIISGSGQTALVKNLDITKAGQVEDFTFNAPAGTGSTLQVSAQSAGLSLLAPKLTVYTASGSVLATVNGAGQYGTTLTASIPYVYAGEQFYVQVQGADTTAMGTGRYALGLSFKGTTPPAEASPIIGYPDGTPLHSGGGEADGSPNDNAYVGAIPVISGISPDNGQSGSDGITDVNQISISGAAPQGDTVTVYENGTALGTATPNQNSAWTYQLLGSLADGVYRFTATQTDPAGNVTPQSAPYMVTIDTQAPNPPVITGITPDTGRSPTDGYTTSTTPTISGTSEPLSLVTLYDSNPNQQNGQTQVVGTALSDINGHWSYTVGTGSVIQQGLNNLTATATDVPGNVSKTSSPSFPLTIITQNKNVPVISGISPITGTIGNTVGTNEPALVFQGTGVAGYTVTASLNGQTLGSTTVNSSGTWTYDNTANVLPDGTYSLTATSTDLSGNVSQATQAYAFAVRTALPAAPVISTMSPVTTQAGSEGYTNNKTNAVFSGTAISNGLVQLYQNGAPIGSVTAAGNGNWTFYSKLNENDGTYDITATVTDSVGNVSAASSPYVMVVKTSRPNAPVISGIAPDVITAGGPLTNNPTPTFYGTADPFTTVTLYQSGKNGNLGTATASASGNWSLTLQGGGLGGSSGSFSFTALETDLAGNVSSSSSTFSLTLDTQVPSAPVVTGISPITGTVNNTVASNQPSLFFTGTAVASTTVNVFLNGGFVGSTVSNSAGAWTFDNTATALPGGNYSLTATAVDLAGNVSQASQSYQFVVYNAAQTAPVITTMSTAYTKVGNIAYTNVLSNPTFSGTTVGNGSVQLFLNGAPIGTTSASGAGNWSFTDYQTFAAGSYYVTASVTDTLGNVSPPSSPLVMVVKTTRPSAPFFASITPEVATSNGGLTNNTHPSFSGTADPGTTVSVYASGQTSPVGTARADASGNWTVTVASGPGLTGGSGTKYTLSAVETDLAGNVSQSSNQLSLTVVTQAPSAPTVTAISPNTSTIQNTVATNQPRLVFQGTGLSGYTVTVSLNGQTLGTTAVNSNGIWTYDNTANVLPDGTYGLTATQTDLAGNISQASHSYAFTVHSALPPAPVITAMSPVTTQIGAEGYTNNKQNAVFTGTTISGGLVQLYQNGTPIGSVTASGSGAWTFYSKLSDSDGTYDITATVTDYVGNVSNPASSPYVMVIKTTTPDTPTILGFTPQTGVVAADTNDVTPTFVGKADPGWMVSLYQTQNGQPQLMGTTTADANGNWIYSVTGTGLSGGSYTITAKTTDPAGNVSQSSAPLPISIITQAPKAPTVTGISPDTGTPGDMVTNSQELNFNGMAPVGTTVTLYLNGVAAGTAPVSSAGNWSVNDAANVLPAGIYSVTATATDGAGNVSQLSQPATVTIQTTPPAAPAVTSISPDTGFSSTDGITNVNVLTFNGTTIPSGLVRVYLDGTLAGTITASGDHGAWSLYDNQSLSAGTHTVTATVTDYVGNTSALSAPFTVTIDQTVPHKPVIGGITPDTGASSTDGITSCKNPTIFGTADPNTLVTFYFGTQSVGSAMANASGNWSVPVPGPGLSDGSYAITATATEVGGNVSQASQSYTLTIDTQTPQAPAVTGISPDSGTAGDMVTNAQQLIFNGTAPAGTTVTLYLNGTAVGAAAVGPPITNGTGTWSFNDTATVLPAGVYSVTTTATDLAGNVSQLSKPATVTIQTAPPAAPAVTSISPDTGSSSTDGITNVSKLTFNGTTIPGGLVQVYVDGTLAGTTTASGDHGGWSLYDNQNLSQGTHTVAATVTDYVGNASTLSAPFTVTIDETAPSTPAIAGITPVTGASSTDGITSATNPTFSGTAQPGTLVMVYNGTHVLCSGWTAPNGIWTATVTGSGLGQGTYSITATATDVAGNVSNVSQSYSLTILTQTQNPQVQGISPDTGKSSNDGITNAQNIKTSGTSSPNCSVQVFQNGVPIGTTTSNSSGSWTFDNTKTTLPAGSYVFTAVATDLAGNVSQVSNSYNVLIETSISTPFIGGVTINNGPQKTLILQGTAEAQSQVQIYLAGSLVATVGADGNGNWNWNSSLPPSNGTYKFTAVATDLAGNVSTPDSFNLQIGGSTAPTANVQNLSGNNVVSSGPGGVVAVNPPTLTGNATAGSVVTIFDGNTVLGTAIANSKGQWTFTCSPLSGGEHTIAVEATNAAGYTSLLSSALTFNV